MINIYNKRDLIDSIEIDSMVTEYRYEEDDYNTYAVLSELIRFTVDSDYNDKITVIFGRQAYHYERWYNRGWKSDYDNNTGIVIYEYFPDSRNERYRITSGYDLTNELGEYYESKGYEYVDLNINNYEDDTMCCAADVEAYNLEYSDSALPQPIPTEP